METEELICKGSDTQTLCKKIALCYKNESPNPDPTYAYEGDSGFDLRAWIKDDDRTDVDTDGNNCIVLEPFECKLIHTGFYCELPKGCEGQVRSRSGLSLKQQLIVLNAPGTIDLFYTNEVGVIMMNLSQTKKVITNGDRVAQFVVCPVKSQLDVALVPVDEIKERPARNLNGYGSSGVK